MSQPSDAQLADTLRDIAAQAGFRLSGEEVTIEAGGVETVVDLSS